MLQQQATALDTLYNPRSGHSQGGANKVHIEAE